MADYPTAFNFMLANEGPMGVITSDPILDPRHPDPTAQARFGLNSHWHPELVAQNFYTYNPDATPKVPNDHALRMAEDTYKYSYWCPIHGYQIIVQDIANKYFDMAVNQGCSEATKIVQRATNQCLTPVAIGYLPLHVDGICGPQTVEAINKANPEELLPAIKSYACQFYRDVAFRESWPPRKLAALLSRANK